MRQLPPLKILACVALGGAIGALTRYGLINAFADYQSTTVVDGSVVRVRRRFPVSTFVANMVGCALIGVLHSLLTQYNWPLVRALTITGFCGALTTMSSFALDVANLAQNMHVEPRSDSVNVTVVYEDDSDGERAWLTIVYILVTNVGGIVLTTASMLATAAIIAARNNAARDLPPPSAIEIEAVAELPVDGHPESAASK